MDMVTVDTHVWNVRMLVDMGTFDTHVWNVRMLVDIWGHLILMCGMSGCLWI